MYITFMIYEFLINNKTIVLLHEESFPFALSADVVP